MYTIQNSSLKKKKHVATTFIPRKCYDIFRGSMYLCVLSVEVVCSTRCVVRVERSSRLQYKMCAATVWRAVVYINLTALKTKDWLTQSNTF